MATTRCDTASTSTSDQNSGEMSAANDELFPGVKDVNTFSQQTLGQLMQATKAAHNLPACGDDYDFYLSYESFREYCHNQSERLLQNINSLMSQQGSSACLTSGSSAPELEDKTDAIIETNDAIMEKVGLLLDEASGLIKPGMAGLPPGSQPGAPQKLMVASWNRQSSSDSNKPRSFHLMHAKNILRPQLKFKDKVDNSNTPFVPILTSKPNALKPLRKVSPKPSKTTSGGKAVPDAVSDFIHQQRVDASQTEDLTAHPYQYELDHFVPDPSQLLPVDSPSYEPLDVTPCTLVNTVEQLEDLSKTLDSLQEFAVDLEHHSYRSFQGFTCLMQISTGRHDYIVDTLELRSNLHILNSSFTKPSIVKVFHGADMDVEWLQRDLGLYVVNMFDTGQAARVLGKARHSLAHLLQLYCGVEPDKSYQLADWRIRPLPKEMLQYGREDTHYLLYIYHRMKNELIERGNEAMNLLHQTLQQSRQVCLRRYKKPIFTDDSHMALWRRNKKTFNPKQYEALRLLYGWRDRLARQEDESTGYILPNHMLFQVAENLPREAHGVLACCNPIPPLVRQQLNEVHQLILKARAFQGKTKRPSLSPKTVPSPTQQETLTPTKPTPKPLNSLLYCPHDPSPQPTLPEAQGHYPPCPVAHDSTLLGAEERSIGPSVPTAKPIITAFDSSSDEDTGDVQLTSAQQKVARLKALFVNPFEMFLPPKHLVQIAPALLEADKIQLSADGNKNNSSTPSSHSPAKVPQSETHSMWTLKRRPKPAPVPVKPKTQATSGRTDANNSAATGGSVMDGDDATAEEEKDTLRQQKRSAPTDDLAEMTYRPPAKRERRAADDKTSPAVPRAGEASSFKPFDYSAGRGRGDRGRGRGDRGRGRGDRGRGRGDRGRGVAKHFDPFSHTPTSDAAPHASHRGRGRGDRGRGRGDRGRGDRGRGRGDRGRGCDDRGRGRGDRGRGVAKHFDPFSHTSTRGRPEFKRGRPKMFHSAGPRERSVTYTKQGGGRGGRAEQHWPKR